jgi:hypothetical protein
MHASSPCTLFRASEIRFRSFLRVSERRPLECALRRLDTTRQMRDRPEAWTPAHASKAARANELPTIMRSERRQTHARLQVHVQASMFGARSASLAHCFLQRFARRRNPNRSRTDDGDRPAGGFSPSTGEIAQAAHLVTAERPQSRGFLPAPALSRLAQLLPFRSASITCFEQLSFRSC